jgi:hypothetical protein
MRYALLGLLVLALAAPASAAEVELMVVGKERLLRGPVDVRLKERTVRVGGRRCRVGARTPLSVLASTSLRLRLEDFGRCGRRARDASGLYVKGIGRERERGLGGWVYKVGRRVSSAGAGDPSRLRGRPVLWFWCVRAGACQRTLEARPERSAVAPGEALRVTVRGFDDQGRGVLVEGATVRLGGASAVTGSDGVAVLAPTEPGRHALTASRPGMVRAFPREVRVG